MGDMEQTIIPYSAIEKVWWPSMVFHLPGDEPLLSVLWNHQERLEFRMPAGMGEPTRRLFLTISRSR